MNHEAPFKGDLRNSRAWLAAITTASLNSFGMFLDIRAGATISGIPMWPSFLSVSVGISVLASLFLIRKTKPYKISCTLYTINSLAVLFTFLYRNPFFAENVVNWVPFQANKLACLVTAMLAPNYWIGIFFLLAHVIGSVLEYNFFSPEIQARIAHGEPWIMVVFGLTGFFVLSYRYRKNAIEWKLMRTQTQAIAYKELAHTMMTLRDKMNSPLQAIELASASLESGTTQDKQARERIERAIATLQAINSEMKKYDLDHSSEKEIT